LTELVLDASVVIKWFHTEREPNVDPARALRAQFEGGELTVLVPPLLCLEIVNVAGRRWAWDEGALVELATGLEALGFEVIEPELRRTASWTARGLTAYDAVYVALAEATETRLVTDDSALADIAGEIALPLADVR
jgi:predicted nucleic acid-binding protein